MTEHNRGVIMYRGCDPVTFLPFVVIVNRFRRVKIDYPDMVKDWVSSKARPWVDIAIKNSTRVSKEQQEREITYILDYPNRVKT